MPSQQTYPIICTTKLAETIAFYEDYFGFVPSFEMACFAMVRHPQKPELCVAFLDADHHTVPAHYKDGVKGLILNLPVENVDLMYQQLYWEGAEVLMEPQLERCGRKHFMVFDPNGVLIDVMQDAQDALQLDPTQNEYQHSIKTLAA